MTKEIPVITIDGLSGSGKGTISKMLCQELGWNILDSGALYRTLTFMLEKNEFDLRDLVSSKEELLKEFQVTFGIDSLGEPVRVFLKGNDITKLVRTEDIAEKTSTLSSLKEVREFIKPCQRNFKQLPGLIADGRDMGTVIFPEANFKFFLVASVEERAKRRQTQLKSLGSEVNMRVLLQELTERDNKDMTRELSPLKPSADALVIDTSNLKPNEVLQEVKKNLKFNIKGK